MSVTALAAPPRESRFGPNAVVQRQRALQAANAVRFGRPVLRQRIRSAGRPGARLLAEAIAAHSPLFGQLYVWQAVQWVPGIGEVKVAALLRSADIDPWRRMRRLREHERALLVEALVAWAEGGSPPRAGRGRRCAQCGEHMRRRTAEGVCGFCVAEGARG